MGKTFRCNGCGAPVMSRIKYCEYCGSQLFFTFNLPKNNFNYKTKVKCKFKVEDYVANVFRVSKVNYNKNGAVVFGKTLIPLKLFDVLINSKFETFVIKKIAVYGVDYKNIQENIFCCLYFSSATVDSFYDGEMLGQKKVTVKKSENKNLPLNNLNLSEMELYENYIAKVTSYNNLRKNMSKNNSQVQSNARKTNFNIDKYRNKNNRIKYYDDVEKRAFKIEEAKKTTDGTILVGKALKKIQKYDFLIDENKNSFLIKNLFVNGDAVKNVIEGTYCEIFITSGSAQYFKSREYLGLKTKM